MENLFIVLIILVSVILTFFVIIQNPKGGGLSSGFAGGSNLMGVKRTGDFLEKGTWTLVIALMVFCLAINIVGPSSTTKAGGLSDQIEAPVQSSPLNLGGAAPAQGQKPAAVAPADSSK